MIDAAANLFITSKEDTDGTVRDVWPSEKPRRRFHDYGYAGLIIAPEESSSISCDDRFAFQPTQFWKLADAQNFA
jgi:hypothetical protein